MNGKNRTNWMPNISMDCMIKRARILRIIRNYLDNGGYLEVETPILCRTTGNHPEINVFATEIKSEKKKTLYLQSSPESCMKRMLANQSGPIYQICKAFRNEMPDNTHNPEFTILEFYMPGYKLLDLMNETEKLIKSIFSINTIHRYKYFEIFKIFLSIDYHKTSLDQLRELIYNEYPKNNINPERIKSRDQILKFIFENIIISRYSIEKPMFVYDFPANQACLAKVHNYKTPIAKRFEMYWNGLELANGYYELTDPIEQHRRIMNDQNKRRKLGLTKVPYDRYLVEALKYGMPNCSGVAIGIDRLIMLYESNNSIDKVISFGINNA